MLHHTPSTKHPSSAVSWVTLNKSYSLPEPPCVHLKMTLRSCRTSWMVGPPPPLGLVPEVAPEPPPSRTDGQRGKRGQHPQTTNDLASCGPGLIF